MLSRLHDVLGRWLRWPRREDHSSLVARRGPRTHVIILDGTMSSLAEGEETNAGLTFKLLRETGSANNLYYEAGIQWHNWKSTHHMLMGRGINRQIRRAYGFLASRYRPGDRIFLFGYSRGAYAVRSMAGVIDRVGLLKAEHATSRNIRQVYRLYEFGADGPTARRFAELYCHAESPIEMIGVWDTVKALGLRLPFVWQLTESNHAFHNTELGPAIRRGYHALARDETRAVFEPVLWTCPDDGSACQVEQVWFPGTHGDIGGQIGDFAAARPLANIPLVWMLEKAEGCGLVLPEGWRDRFPMDAKAPSVGTWRGWGKIFLIRSGRVIGRDRSERLYQAVGAGPPPAGAQSDRPASPDQPTYGAT
ncbi:DUF2235 domain-containing protein [Aquicoccus sp. SCR17]|nr:DUF2235 domain-containing protein [Carideicomes alvinocaridis]